jgi:hypothetical protein
VHLQGAERVFVIHLANSRNGVHLLNIYLVSVNAFQRLVSITTRHTTHKCLVCLLSINELWEHNNKSRLRKQANIGHSFERESGQYLYVQVHSSHKVASLNASLIFVKYATGGNVDPQWNICIYFLACCLISDSPLRFVEHTQRNALFVVVCQSVSQSVRRPSDFSDGLIKTFTYQFTKRPECWSKQGRGLGQILYVTDVWRGYEGRNITFALWCRSAVY